MANPETRESAPAARPIAKAPRPDPESASEARPTRKGRPPSAAGGALFRALVDAGADAVVAYTATDETESMIAASVTSAIQPMFLGIQETLREHDRKLEEHSRKLDEHGRKLDEHGRKLDEHGRKLDEHGRKLDEHSRKLDEHTRMLRDLDARLTVVEAEVRAIRELLEANLAAIRTQFRLVWGALGLLVTVLITVFGFLFTQ